MLQLQRLNIFSVKGIRHNIGSFLRVIVVNTEEGRCKRVKE